MSTITERRIERARNIVRTSRTVSRPDRIREVFRKYPGVMLTRAEITEKCLALNGWPQTNHDQVKYFSMALSRMVDNSEVTWVNLLGKKAYQLLF